MSSVVTLGHILNELAKLQSRGKFLSQVKLMRMKLALYDGSLPGTEQTLNLSLSHVEKTLCPFSQQWLKKIVNDSVLMCDPRYR